MARFNAGRGVVACGLVAAPEHLPRAETAVIPPAKLRDYCLNPEHATGRNKARVFAWVLGIYQANWEYLAGQLLAGVQTALISRIEVKPDGTGYEVIVSVDGLNGATASVKSGWFIDAEPADASPRLTSAYVDIP